MKKIKAVFYTALALSFFNLAGCDKIFPSSSKNKGIKQAVPSVKEALVVEVKGTLIAKVNNQPITLEELNDEIDSFNGSDYVRQRPEEKIDTKEKKVGYLKTVMIRRILLAQAAIDKGLDRKEEVSRALENQKMAFLAAKMEEEETKEMEATSKEIEDFYTMYKDQFFKEPEERKMREIVVASESDVKDILIELLKGADFATLAQMRSISSSAKNGGDLGFIKKGEKSPKFEEAAFASSLEVGKTSTYFKDTDGYYILKLEAKKGGKVKTQSEVWDQMKMFVTLTKVKEKVDTLVSKLSENAKIEVIESAVK